MRLFQQLSGLSVLVSLVLAHEGHSHDHHHHDHSHDHEDLGGINFCGDGGSLTGGCQDGLGNIAAADQKVFLWKEKENETTQQDSPASDEDDSTLGNHPWTHTKPCFTSAETNHTLCVFTDNHFASNRGASFITTPERATFFTTTTPFLDPSLTKDINQDLHRTIPSRYEKQLIPGKGMGLIAKVHIPRGALIMANTPSLMIDYRAFEDLPKDSYRQLQASAVDHLPPLHREHIMALSTHDSADRSHIEKIDKICGTNAFDIDPHPEDPMQDHGFYVVFPEISRMNHDCRPNADYYFSHDTLTQYIHAIRDIIPGEELTLSYINPVMKHKARNEKLNRIWGFQCSCPLCTAPTPQQLASDTRIAQIRDFWGEFSDWSTDSRASPQLAELVASLYEQEKLWGNMYEAYTWLALEYNAAGEPWTAVKWANKAVERGIPVVGENDSDVLQMERLIKDPWAHWSWMKRVRVRGGWGKGREREGEENHENDDDE
ncbi:hypothetical protein QBC40DRAFT_348630 [Triangularia verruculosa]|uniref:SET domain-containing protein n=1 Tax=Triangularia verruculosa TaxID=2587418 RepID=A0AAN6XJK1_9PEZI|nr:hypothetical protein QBC40DRAFT_348630 [Triangularia verruculosa]